MLAAPALPARAWGGTGHAYTAYLAVRALPAPLRELYDQNLIWFLRESSAPDRWRNRDKSENPRHFLDTERFGFGTDIGKIPRRFEDVVKLRNWEQLQTDGLLPWTVERQYQLLVNAFRARRWEDVMVHSAAVSHYVADAHVPLHATENYDGQLSQPPQRGVHGRWESALLERSIHLTDLKTGAPTTVSDPVAATFTVLAGSLALAPGVLAMDREAAQAGNGEYNDAYWAAFTPRARPVAIARLEAGGRDLAGMLVAAWNEAGRPAPPRSFTMTEDHTPIAPPFTARGQTPPPTPEPVRDEVKEIARGHVRSVTVPSQRLGRDVPVSVLLPRDYATSGRRYSVLYLLHGNGDNQTSWNDKSGIAAYVADEPLIVVMPDARTSRYINSPGQGRYAVFFFDELIPFVDKTYRTIARRDGRALAGLSMGGYGAWRLGLDHPELFASAASLSGSFNWGEADFGSDAMRPRAVALYGGDTPETRRRYAADSLLPQITRRIGGDGRWNGPALYFDIGTEDALLEANRKTAQFLMERRVPHEYAEYPGAHTWDYWDEHIRDALHFTLRHVAPPEAKR